MMLHIYSNKGDKNLNLKKYFHKILFCLTSVVRDIATRFLYFNVLKFLSVDNYIDSLSLRQCHRIIQNQWLSDEVCIV